MALELVGREQVLSRVGVEPSGGPFNAIEFDPVFRRPYNPMVNAGAITVAGILRDALGPDRAFDVILDRFSEAAGRQLYLNEAVISLGSSYWAPKSSDWSPATERRSALGTSETST